MENIENTYQNGKIIVSMTPKQYAVYSLMLGGLTAQQAETMLSSVYSEAIEAINIYNLNKNNACKADKTMIL